MAQPALATAVSNSLQFLVANATHESPSAANASATWRRNALQQAEMRLELYINTGIITFWIVVLIALWRKYKKATSAIVLLWLVWFVAKAVQTQEAAVHAVEALASTALTKTREACIAIYYMFLSWGRLFAPAITDLITLLTPPSIAAWHGIVTLWNMSNWVEKGYFLLILLVIAGVIFTVIQMYRQMKKAAEHAKEHKKRLGLKVTTCRDILKDALFQASFLIIGPGIWWITTELPGIFPSVAANLSMSLYPMIQSLIVMKKLQVQREEQESHRKTHQRKGSSSDLNVKAGAAFFQQWLDMKRQIAAEDEDSDEEVQKTSDEELKIYNDIKKSILHAREWLAYWSCWPIFFVVYYVIGLDVVPEEEKPQAYGLIVAMVIWVNVWGLAAITAITPFFFALLIVLLDAFSGCFLRFAFGMVGKGVNKAAEVKDQVIKDGMMDGVMDATGATSEEQQQAAQQKKLLYFAGFIVILLAVVSFFFQAVAASTGILTAFIQWGMGIEAAKLVKKTTKFAMGHKGENPGESFELIPHRLAFWVIQTIWVLFVSAMQFVWINGFLSSFTPFIFGLVIFVGEDSVKYFLKMMVCIRSTAHGVGRVTRMSTATSSITAQAALKESLITDGPTSATA